MLGSAIGLDFATLDRRRFIAAGDPLDAAAGQSPVLKV
jgi:hypothetical protein